MYNDWEKWCRLCARCSNKNNNFNIYHNSDGCVQVIKDFFQIMVDRDDKKPTALCQKCHHLLIFLKRFRQNCIKVQQMFDDILEENNEIDKNLLENKRYEFEKIIQFNDNFYPIKSSILKIDEWIDSYNIDDEDITVKKEIEHISIEPELPENINEEFNSSSDIKVETIKQSDEDEEEDILGDLDDSLDSKSDSKEKIKESTPKPKKIKSIDKIIKCELCDKIFNKRPSYRNHKLSKHSNAKLFCSQCPKFFSSKNSLRSHEKTHLPDNIKFKFNCTFCERKFSMAANLKAHIRTIHYNERAFVCDECGKGFKTKATLQGHQLSHTEERPFPCPNCPKRFKSLAMLNTHSDHHTDTKYACTQCDAVFNTKKSLSSHLVVHTDEKKHKCKFCGNEYKRYKALKYHLISHTGFRHSCPYCEKTFADISNCRNHQKSIHPVEYAKQLELKQAMQDPKNINQE